VTAIEVSDGGGLEADDVNPEFDWAPMGGILNVKENRGDVFRNF